MGDGADVCVKNGDAMTPLHKVKLPSHSSLSLSLSLFASLSTLRRITFNPLTAKGIYVKIQFLMELDRSILDELSDKFSSILVQRKYF